MAKRRKKTSDKPYHLCIDRVVPPAMDPARSRMERSFSRSASRMISDTGEIDASAVLGPASLALVIMKMWDNGTTLKCKFLDGSATQKRKVEAKAKIWEKYANIKFKFVSRGNAEIRISFSADPGSWSAVGIDALNEGYFPKHQPTMNFGWLKDDSSDSEYGRVVVHEFGHALGCVHEHQSPASGLKWNKAEVYRVYSGAPNFWNKAEIDHNIFGKYSKTQTQFTDFDPDSIMLYAFDGRLFTDGQGTNFNTVLSKSDKEFMAKMYPKPTPRRKKSKRKTAKKKR